MKPVQEELKQIRLEKGISLKEISRKTKIRLDFLKRIEEGDFSVTPMPYIRAFLREYGELVGVDPDLVMMKLDNKVESILTQKPGQKTTEKSAPITTVSSETVNKQSEHVEETVVPSEDTEILESETTIDKPEPESEEIQISLFEEPAETKEDNQQLDDNREDDLPEDTDTPEEEISQSEKSGFEETDMTPSQPEETVENELTHEKPELPVETDIKEPPVIEEPLSSGDEAKEEIIGEKHELTEVSVKRKPLVIEEPDSTNKIYFAILLSLLFIIALIIVFFNRGSLF